MIFERYPVVFDPKFMASPGVQPRGPVGALPDCNQALPVVKHYLNEAWPAMIRKPNDGKRHPYVVPGASYESLWDWDAFFTSSAMPESGLPYAKGSVLNLVEHALETTGRPPKKIGPNGDADYYSFPYPLHAQFAYIVAARLDDFAWIEPIWRRLVGIRSWFDRETLTKSGDYVWLHMYGNGIDNNPGLYGRAPLSTAGIDLASWHYRDLRAMAKLSRFFQPQLELEFLEQAARLKMRVQAFYWDAIDRFFYNVDCTTDRSQLSRQEILWPVHLKFRNWASLFPLWAQLATAEQAAEIAKKIMSADEFLSSCGIRSHSKVDPIYNNVPMGDPSNWQGPVWGLTTFLTAYGLARYGYKEEALDICWRTVRTFAADIMQNQCLHEYYDGDSGQPLARPGFLNWNLLALKAVDDIAHGIDCTTFDLLESSEKG